MSHQSKPRGVEAGGDLTAHRQACAAAGDQFEDMMRTGITELAGQCHQTPWPRESFYDAQPQRARPISINKFGQLLGSLARDRSLPTGALSAFGHKLLAFVLALEPQTPTSLLHTWEAETAAQADADVAQARALRAIETHDLPAVEHAIEETTQHLTHTQRLLLRLTVARRDIIAQRRRSLHAIGG